MGVIVAVDSFAAFWVVDQQRSRLAYSECACFVCTVCRFRYDLES